MVLVLYSGRRGSGKTLTMVKDAYKYFLNGWKIYSNLHLSFEHTFMTTEDIMNIDNTTLSDVVLLVDELQVIMDSRRSARDGNLSLSYFIQQIRKRRIVLLATAQFTGDVDKRFREQLDVMARPKFVDSYGIVEVTYFDLTSRADFGYIESQSIVYDPEPLFGFYDTYQEIQNAGSVKSEK